MLPAKNEKEETKTNKQTPVPT